MPDAEQEKRSAALNSVLAAVGLTGLKLVIGLLSGSLGILAEAAHSGLDLAAALVTYFAVRISAKPADSNHLYGHGKVENLSAFFETVLLLVTCVWIIHEAYDRLVVKTVEVNASIWAFGVMAISIVVDVSRSRMLYRVARKHNSQALEADALHFSTDIWSSTVVLLGLLGVKIAEWFPELKFLLKADALAALGVAIIVIYVSVRLGIRTIEGLLDTAPSGMAERIKTMAEAIDEVRDCHAVRVRTSGPCLFIDVHVTLDWTMPLLRAHEITEQIEDRIRRALPSADVTVHPEPTTAGKEPGLQGPPAAKELSATLPSEGNAPLHSTKKSL
jgi:cation diffusion facilitator family transporter